MLQAQLENQRPFPYAVPDCTKRSTFYSNESTASQGLGAMTGTVAIAAFRESLDSAWSTILPPRYASYLQHTKK